MLTALPGSRSTTGYSFPAGSSPPVPTPQQRRPQHGRTQHLGITPRRVTRQVRPGYTASGGQIIHAEISGNIGRCVARDNHGLYKMFTASEAGGMEVIRAAVNLGVPGFQTTGWKDMRSSISEMGEYGILWVATGSWDRMSRRLPNTTCGFFHNLNGTYTEVAASRSNLKLLLGRAADRMIVESMAPQEPDLTVEEAFEMIYGVSHEERQTYWEEHPCARCGPTRRSR